MMGIQGSKVISLICLAILTKYQSMTDKTSILVLCIALCSKNWQLSTGLKPVVFPINIICNCQFPVFCENDFQFLVNSCVKLTCCAVLQHIPSKHGWNSLFPRFAGKGLYLADLFECFVVVVHHFFSVVASVLWTFASYAQL